MFFTTTASTIGGLAVGVSTLTAATTTTTNLIFYKTE
jgi:hypothetical protein